MMKKRIFTVLSLGLLVSALLIFNCGKQESVDDLYQLAQANKDKLRFGTYVTVDAVETCLNDEAGRREALSIINSLGITKIYLETYRSGKVANENLLKTVRDFFVRNKIDVVGGIATVPGEKFGVRQEGQLSWFNFQAPKTQSDLEKVVRLTARIFDEMIIDDFLCSADTSALSRQVKGTKSWSQYRMDLMTDLSKNLFIKAARAENPDISIIIKYPQWYDRFHKFGYDVDREPKLYDKVWVGTETRGAATPRMGFVQQYEGLVNFRWLNACSSGKVAGAWFDHIDCDEFDFINQAYQSILAGAKEIVLFNYFDLMYGHRGHHWLRRQFSDLIKLATMVQKEPVKGIYGYKPPHSEAENDFYIFDYLGMIGLPLLPTSEYPMNADVIFLPTQAAKDADLLEKIQQSIDSGKSVIITPGLLKAMNSQPLLLDLAGIKSWETLKPPQANQLIWRFQKLTTDIDVQLPANLILASAEALLLVENNKRWIPFLTINKFASGGQVFVLNVETFNEQDFRTIGEVLLAPKPVAWLDLPEEWLNYLREVFLKPIHVSWRGKSRISLHLFAEDNRVLCNFNNELVSVELKWNAKENQKIVNGISGEELKTTGELVVGSIEKRSFLWLKKESKTSLK